MRIVYTGPLQETVIAATRQHARRGQPVDVPADIATGLLKQATWETAPPVKRRPPPRKSTRTRDKE